MVTLTRPQTTTLIDTAASQIVHSTLSVVTVQKKMAAKMPESRNEQEEEQAAREWADEQAAFVGGIWASRYPGGRDW